MNEASVASALRRAQLELINTDNPRLEAGILLCHVLDWHDTKLISHADELLNETQLGQFNALIQRRLAGEPSAYIVAERAFWTLDLAVTSDTLIPRPDTETLVEQALELIAEQSNPRVLDMGTGSGAIALSIASERPDARVEASDFSAAALQVAKCNADKLGIDIHSWHCGSWFDALPQHCGTFDLIVSNPPYIATNDPHLHALKFEPLSALISGVDGLDDIRELIAGASAYLSQNAQLVLEHGHDQAQAVAQLFERADFRQIQHRADLAAIVRTTAATAPKG